MPSRGLSRPDARPDGHVTSTRRPPDASDQTRRSRDFHPTVVTRRDRTPPVSKSRLDGDTVRGGDEPGSKAAAAPHAVAPRRVRSWKAAALVAAPESRSDARPGAGLRPDAAKTTGTASGRDDGPVEPPRRPGIEPRRRQGCRRLCASGGDTPPPRPRRRLRFLRARRKFFGPSGGSCRPSGGRHVTVGSGPTRRVSVGRWITWGRASDGGGRSGGGVDVGRRISLAIAIWIYIAPGGRRCFPGGRFPRRYARSPALGLYIRLPVLGLDATATVSTTGLSGHRGVWVSWPPAPSDGTKGDLPLVTRTVPGKRRETIRRWEGNSDLAKKNLGKEKVGPLSAAISRRCGGVAAPTRVRNLASGQLSPTPPSVSLRSHPAAAAARFRIWDGGLAATR